MSSNWYTERRNSTTPSKLNGSSIGIGASTAAAYEINPMRTGGLDNSIFRISATKVVDENLHTASTPSDEVDDDDTMRDYQNRMTDVFEASMQLSDDASSTGRVHGAKNRALSRNSLDGSSSDVSDDSQPQTRKKRPAPAVPHLRDLSVVDPFDPFRKAKRASGVQRSSEVDGRVNKVQSSTSHMSPPERKSTYKVVKGRAPQPPSMNNTTANNSQPSSLHRVVYNRADKRPAPPPPNVHEQDFWQAVDEESSRAPPKSGAVEMRVRRRKQRNDFPPPTASSEAINLTFREKMARFFGLTGNRKKKERSRAVNATFSNYSSEVVYGPSRYGSTKTLQSFSFAHSKIYSPRTNVADPVMSGGNFDVVKPQANGVVKIQRKSPGPVLQGHEVRWSNRQSNIGASRTTDQAHVRRADFRSSSAGKFDPHLHY